MLLAAGIVLMEILTFGYFVGGMLWRPEGGPGESLSESVGGKPAFFAVC